MLVPARAIVHSLLQPWLAAIAVLRRGSASDVLWWPLRFARCAALLVVGVAPCALAAEPRSIPSFEVDIQPIITASGCNSGPCHGKARGQNGFKLSLFGYDPDYDYSALTQQARGRRVFFASPEHSLLLQKACGDLPHGGGIRLPKGSDDYEIIRQWIAAGAPRRVEGEPQLERVELVPTSVTARPGEEIRLRVTAYYSNGASRDVTRWTTFQSNESALVGVAKDRPHGTLAVGRLPGEATVMARFMSELATCSVAIPFDNAVQKRDYEELSRQNFIDTAVWHKLEAMKLLPSDACDDATYLRRVSIDLIGRLPSPEEASRFLSDSRPDRRRVLVDELLERPEYADHWANVWADLLRPNPYRVGMKSVYAYDEWIRRQFRANRPYDEMVRDLLTAQGSTWHNGAVVLYRDRRSPDELATMVSQLFLGIRLECAKCHHHPFEKWSQRDFYSFAAFFGQLARKGTGLSPPISGSEEFFFDRDTTVTAVRHPVTGEVLQPRPLYGEIPPEAATAGWRTQLAAWLTSPSNEYFARVIVNRVWAQLMGRGIVEPVDDIRVTNPPSNPELLDALAKDFVDHHYDLKHLLRTITRSRVYALSSLPNATNTNDTRNYSRYYRQRLRAEVLLQAIIDVTGVDDRYSALPPGSRPNQIWTHRVPSVFLDTFGRPDPNQDPPCERLPDTTVTQTLHLMNAEQIQAKISHPEGRVAKLVADESQTPETIIDQLYLATYARHPSPDELSRLVERFPPQREAWRSLTEDLLWALFNSPEFLFKQ